MEDTAYRAIAIVGVGAVLPDAVNAAAFWKNIKNSRYSITDVTPDRWDPAYYYDPDPKAPDKSYSKIGGWVREHVWEPAKWKLAIPPCVVQAMDDGQKWAISCTRDALLDYGYPERRLDLDRTAVILGNAMAGEKHYFTSLRIYFPEYAHELAESSSFAALPEAMRRDITRELHQRMTRRFPAVTEDTMPGELSNCIAGRIANTFNLHGPNYVVDAACASAMAAITSAAEGLIQRDFDVAITGGVDRNMGAPSFVKFCKIGALSATGSRPFAEGADGFVMGEGAAVFLLKRLADAERDGDKIYAVLRGIGGASDGKGKGITAPNPIGQKLAVERAWQNAGLDPATVTLIEGHGTSTRVGDVVEVQSFAAVLNDQQLPPASIALGSVKSNLGHLKSAAGAAGFLKTTLALHHKMLPPSLNFKRPNPDIDFSHSPLFVNTELRPWMLPDGKVRRAGLSAFGFGGTNFHAVLEEHIPGRINGNGKRSIAVNLPATVVENKMNPQDAPQSSQASSGKAPLRGAIVIGATTETELVERLRLLYESAKAGSAPAPVPPSPADLHADERIAIDYGDAAELADKSAKALKAFDARQPLMWKALRAQGVFRGHGPGPKVAFLYTGQGSQYANMLKDLCAVEPILADTFADADRVMTPLLGKPLTKFIFVDPADSAAVEKAEEDLRQTAITQPAVLATDLGLTRLFAAYGVQPDMTMGHSLGEYGALVAAGALPFDEALEAVSARGREMTRVSVEDKGRMAAVFAPLDEIERVLKTIDGYVVIANINSNCQAVIGGATKAVEQAIEAFTRAGQNAVALPVSHAFHTSIVAPASEPLRRTLERLHLQSPRVPTVANVSGEFYPMGPNVVPQMLDILGRQVASPVQFIKGLRTLYDAGARVFVEVGPKKALHGFVEDVLGDRGDVLALFSNHPKLGDVVAFNQALCGLYASGLGRAQGETAREVPVTAVAVTKSVEAVPVVTAAAIAKDAPSPTTADGRFVELGRMFADVLERGWQIYGGQRYSSTEPVVITGASLGLPGTEHIFDDENVARILRGDQFIGSVPARFRQAMLDKHITRLVKSATGEARFETLNDVADVIKLAARGGGFDLESEFGVPRDRVDALDRVTKLAIAAGIDALRDAGIPLVMRYKTTSKGTQLPDRWALPEDLRDDTGVIFGSAFPGCDSFADIMSGYYEDHARHEKLTMLETLRGRLTDGNGHAAVINEVDRQIGELRDELEKHPYVFDRRFLFRVLSMGHSQFAEYIGARGPNTQINSACATTTQAFALAEDWIRAGRCRRVIVVSADDVTSDNLMDWMGAGFLASGAAATDEVVEDAAIPFDRRRHGLIIGMGAAALVVESAEAARERGIRPICEVLNSVTANSAFHGSRLDVQHIGQMMENLVAQAEQRYGFSRYQIAPRTMFVSHETYTPARGGSASAEIFALRRVFGDSADQIVIANTKGFTGHAMGTGVEDVVAIKALETGCVPPVANFKEVDPELGELHLSKGGTYPVEYALRLGAGFGSQISLSLLRWVATKDGVRPAPAELGYKYRIVDTPTWNAWLSRMAGHATADLEVVKRTLRVRDQAARSRTAELVQEARPAVAVPAVIASAVPVSAPEPLPAKPAVELKVAAAAAGAAAGSVVIATRIIEPTPIPVIAPLAPSAIAAPAKPAPSDLVKDRILALVAEKTGYPIDMLDVDLDLEADLGVDTVKQAEVFATVREAYSIPREDTLKLRDFPTLAHVIRFVYGHRPDLRVEAQPVAKPVVKQEAAAVPTPPVVAQTQVVGGDSVKERILALVVEKTGYPKDMLDLDLDLEADLGVDTVKQAEMFAAIREIYNIPRDENVKLRDFPTLARVIGFVYDKRPDLAAPATAAVKPAELITPPPIATVPPAQEQPNDTAQAQVEPVKVSGESIKDKLLEIVAEKTGYPKDMLDLDLDLEADLGIDTVKQAEMFAAVRTAYDIPRDENMKLRDFPTLARVIRFVHDKRPDLVAPNAVNEAPAEVTPPTNAAPPPVATPEMPEVKVDAIAAIDESVKDKLLEIVAEKTGYPKDMLDLDLDLEADLGIDTVKQAEMFAAVRAAYNIPRDENMKLRDFPTLGHVIRFVYDKRPELAGVAPTTGPIVPSPSEAPAPEVSASPAQVESVVPAPTLTAPAVTDDEIKKKILDIVAEKTGYPNDMLDLDLDLEADLGIDTVKQAEMFAAVRAAYNIPRDENLKLRDFPTLAHVIKFAHDRVFASAAHPPAVSLTLKSEPAAAPSNAQEQPKPVAVARPPVASFEAANRIPRRVPIATVRPPLAMCKQTGVTLGPGCRVVIMPDSGGVGEALAQRLQQQGVESFRLDRALAADKLVSSLNEWLATGPVHGVFWLPALDDEGPLSNMDLVTWHEALRIRVKSLYSTMRTLYEQVAGPGTFLVSATRLGGNHGYDEGGAVAPLGGAVMGFTKTYKRERPDVLVKALDFEAQRSSAEVAQIVIDETLRDPGAVEIGYKDGLRWTVALQEQPAVDGKPGFIFDADTVFLVTGAAGSIVSAITADLAAASGGTFYLLDLVPEPDANDPDIKRFVSDREGLKRDLFARIQARGERATPALVERELAALERSHAALSAITAVREAGGTAHYFSVNLTDADAVTKVIQQVRERSGRIDVLLHAAGMERSHFLPQKDPREFDLVFDVKTDGWFNLLHAIADMPLGATVAFSSIAGRFGNAGQTDYSSANDLLCKITSSFRTTRPGTRAIAIDWTAWGGIGMATRGSIPKMMELAGIDMLPPEAGVPMIRRELTLGGTRGEVLIGQRLGVMLNEPDPSGGVDPDTTVDSNKHLSAPGPMIGKIAVAGVNSPLAIETTLDPKIQAFLHDHQIDGIPVLPGVMGIEAFAETALCLLPGWHIAAVEAIRFLAPFKFYRSEPRVVTVQTTISPRGDDLVAECKLIGRRSLPNQPEPQVTTHFTARVRLTKRLAEAVTVAPVSVPTASMTTREDIYQVYFHGPAYQVVGRAWWDGKRVIGELSKGLPAHHQPSERPLVMAPRLIELCFQTAGLWELGLQSRFGLPQQVESVRVLRDADAERTLFAVVTPHPERETFDAEVVDAAGNCYVQLIGYRTIALPSTADVKALHTLKAAMSLKAAA